MSFELSLKEVTVFLGLEVTASQGLVDPLTYSAIKRRPKARSLETSSNAQLVALAKCHMAELSTVAKSDAVEMCLEQLTGLVPKHLKVADMAWVGRGRLGLRNSAGCALAQVLVFLLMYFILVALSFNMCGCTFDRFCLVACGDVYLEWHQVLPVSSTALEGATLRHYLTPRRSQ